MMKKILLPLFALALVISAAFTGSHSKESELVSNFALEHKTSDMQEAKFVHTVFFWMKEDLSAEEAKFFEKGMEKLGQVPSIHSYRWGKPAGTPREVVDNSYTYAWIVDFASTEDQDAYQVDPVHLKFIEECKDLWTKVQVYDTILN